MKLPPTRAERFMARAASVPSLSTPPAESPIAHAERIAAGSRPRRGKIPPLIIPDFENEVRIAVIKRANAWDYDLA